MPDEYLRPWPRGETPTLLPAALLLYRGSIPDAVGLTLFAAAVALHLVRVRRVRPPAMQAGT